MQRILGLFWEKTHFWYLGLVGLLIIASFIWSNEVIDIQLHDTYFVTSFSAVFGLFIVYFLVLSLVYYGYARKNRHLNLGLKISHFLFNLMVLLHLSALLEKCQKVMLYQQKVLKHASQDMFDVLTVNWDSGVVYELRATLGWIVLGIILLIINIVKYRKEVG